MIEFMSGLIILFDQVKHIFSTKMNKFRFSLIYTQDYPSMK